MTTTIDGTPISPSATGAGTSQTAIAAKFTAFRALREVAHLTPKFTAIDLDEVREMRQALESALAAVLASQDALERENSRVTPDEDGFCVIYAGRLCSPRWMMRGAAEAYLRAVLAGTRNPEFEDVTNVMR